MHKDLIRAKDDLKILTFDFETEDLNLFDTNPWQLAFNKASMKGGIFEENDFYIYWPNLRVSEGAARVTRFEYNEWESKARPAEEVMEIFNNACRWADIIVGHNIFGFDIEVYYSYCKKIMIQPLPIYKKFFDTMAVFKAYRLEKDFIPKNDFISWQITLAHFYDKNIIKRGFSTLKKAAQTFDIDFDDKKAHNALYDISVNHKVAQKLFYKFPVSTFHFEKF